MSEKRIVNPDTGGEKGQKLERYDLIPWEVMEEVARVYGVGAEKYAEHNWSRGYDWSLSYAALMRHLTQFWMGESYDKESECHHLASVIFHALALMYFEKHHPELDNRLVTKREQ
jgi:hypothetical protein